MEWIETTGPTLAEAKDAALDQLGVDEQDAEFEVLEEPRSGLFGRTRGEARVRARVRPTRPRPKEDHARRRNRRERENSAGTGSDAGAGVAVRSDVRAAAADLDANDGPEVTGASPTAASTGAEAASAGESKGRRRRRGGGAAGRGNSKPLGEDEIDNEKEPAAMANGDTMEAGSISLEQHGAVVKDFLEGLLDKFNMPAKVNIHLIDDETVEAAVTGDDLGLLIGPRGATLAALQELARTVVQRHAPGIRTPRVLIDVASYRQKRRAALERFTLALADEVKASGESRRLEPMLAADRKVVHDTVNGIDGVHTISEGEEPRRHVVIIPD